MTAVKFSEAVANALVEHGITHIFGIIGSANAHLFDSVYHHPDLTLVCLHHEQSCVMAAHGYYKQSGKMAAVLVTAGAGAVNSLTGVVGSFADSIPVLVITGQEATKQFKANNLARMVGVLGVYTERVFESCTKRVTTCMSVESAFFEIVYALRLCKTPRYGPCVVDIPIDIQAGNIGLGMIEQLRAVVSATTMPIPGGLAEQELSYLTTAIKNAKEPLLWLGDGLRSIFPPKIQSYIADLGIPYLTSWAATDLFDNIPSLYAGHAGVYGSRAGNLALQSCDLLLALGTRLSVPQKGYVDTELARRAQIYVVDCDPVELEKLGPRFTSKLLADAPTVLEQLHTSLSANPWLNESWLEHIAQLRSTFPLLESCHYSDTWINSYSFVAALGQLAPSNTTFVTDVGTAFLTAGQVLEPNGGQRLIMSQGLGEMGYGLTGAIGAWFADNSRLVVCMNTDGGLMMNLQEMHSVISNNIPLKLVIFNNDGYLMMKHTQTAIVSGRRAGTDPQSGLSIPSYEPLVKVFGFNYISLRSGDGLTDKIEQFLTDEDAVVLEVFMDPDQPLVPKLSVSIAPDGTFLSPPLEDLSPLIPLDQLKKYLLAPVHPNSEAIARPATDS